VDTEKCNVWHNLKKLVTKVYIAQIVDILFDLLGLPFALAFTYLAVQKRYKYFQAVVATFCMISFLSDIVTMTVVNIEARASQDSLESLKASFCFTQGDGYDVVHDFAVSMEDVVVNSGIMIGLAVCGVFADGAHTIVEFQNHGEGITWLAIMASLFELAEVGYAIYDFSKNTIDVVSGIEAIETAMLGLGDLEKGHVCVQVNPSFNARPIEALGVHQPWGEVVFGTLLIVFLPAIALSVFGYRRDVQNDVTVHPYP
jgi:hypothetical protein